MSYIWVSTRYYGTQCTADVWYTDGSFFPLSYQVSREELQERWGITIVTSYPQPDGTDRIDLTPIMGAGYQTGRVAKLYGPVNGQTKLIHQGFGHLTYNQGN